MAIALDTTNVGAANGTTSVSWTHTCTGSNLILFVGGDGAVGSDNWTGVTYNGVAMTRVGTVDGGVGRNTYLYVLQAPASGAHSVVVSASAGTQINGTCSVSYTGAKQTGGVDSSNTASNASTTSLTASTTVVASSCWLVGCSWGNPNGATIAAGTGTTLRVSGTNPGGILFDSNATVGTGSQSLVITNSSSAMNMVVASFAPAASTTNSNFLSFM